MYFLPTLLQFEIQKILLGTMNCIKLHLLLYPLENTQLFNRAHIFKIINTLYKISSIIKFYDICRYDMYLVGKYIITFSKYQSVIILFRAVCVI